MRKPQTVKITWFPYPEYSPEDPRCVIVDYAYKWYPDGDQRKMESTTGLAKATYFEGGDLKGWVKEGGGGWLQNVTAWAEVPEGYKEE